MAEHTPLSPADREHLAQLARSQGWRVFLTEFLVPQLLHASRQIDSPNNPELRTQLFRGQKLALSELMRELYKYADLPNPFERHWEAFTVALHASAPPAAALSATFMHYGTANETTTLGQPQRIVTSLCAAADAEQATRDIPRVTCPDCLAILEEQHARRTARRATPVL